MTEVEREGPMKVEKEEEGEEGGEGGGVDGGVDGGRGWVERGESTEEPTERRGTEVEGGGESTEGSTEERRRRRGRRRWRLTKGGEGSEVMPCHER